MITHPTDKPIAVWFEMDCDGPLYAWFDCEHPTVTTLPYGEEQAIHYLTRSEFEKEVLSKYDNWTQQYWREEGYLSAQYGTLVEKGIRS